MKDIEAAVQKVVTFFNQHHNSLAKTLRKGVSGEAHLILSQLMAAVAVCEETVIELWKRHTDQFLDDQELHSLANLEYISQDDEEVGLLRQMMNIGFVAAANGMSNQAQSIFNAVCKMREGSELPVLGIALSDMYAGNLDKAIETLKNQAMEINSKSDYAKSFLALAYKLSNMKQEFEKLSNEIIMNSKNSAVVRMVNKMAEWGPFPAPSLNSIP